MPILEVRLWELEIPQLPLPSTGQGLCTFCSILRSLLWYFEGVDYV